jgi:FAD/FMN-containing dehydrogenase
MRTEEIASWGNALHGSHVVVVPRNRFEAFPETPGADSALPFGQGRSYGDSCLNIGGALVSSRQLDHFIEFDPDKGTLKCEGGVLLADILELVVPRGWFLPVVPGTQNVTVGGAIANDVHGKNHHRAGTFGCHVLQFELLRSTGERLTCSPSSNASWFAATIGGLGLTGMIVSAELQLRAIPGPGVRVESLRFEQLEDFFELSEDSADPYEYTVAWIDCLARGRHLGRGIFQRANHCALDASRTRAPARLSLPVSLPFSLVNPLSLRVFNAIHYHRAGATSRCTVDPFESFFFPLDRIEHWNRLYGAKGFHQYQCVVPVAVARDAIRLLLGIISTQGIGSFLAVLKQCGPATSCGLLSFPMEGTTLALDFPAGTETTRLFERLDEVVIQAGGRLYPAKDSRMPAHLFQSGYPRWRELASFRDPRCQSTFWRRVTEGAL